MFPATPQRTADRRLVAPTPITEAEITCVVETGKPRCAVAKRMPDELVWAAKPCGGSSLNTRLPTVRMIRQPPTYVPAAIAVPAARMTQVGTSGVERFPLATSA